MELDSFYLICYIWLAIAVIIHVVMFFYTAPFGRHTNDRWGPLMDNKLGWIIMEFPSLLVMLLFLVYGTYSLSSYAWILFVFWLVHYSNRTFIYPFRIRSKGKKMPVFIVANGIMFNLMNAGLNGYFLAELSTGSYNDAWLFSPITWAGIALFITGMLINWRADHILINLRKPNETGYKIPKGFLFDYISSPNLFGEVLEWTGFAVMAWNLPALTFMVWTMANLIPRAKNHHDWYHNKFEDYPKKRKVIFPFFY